MQFALDKDDNRVWIDDTHSNQAYFCPYCGTELITRKGDIRRHHFAHRTLQRCKDSWVRDKKYDESDWHYDWQNEFPANNREIKLELGQVKHRADVIIDHTVIEFQHSLLSESDFNERNSFYFNLGYKVIWLFDLSDLYGSKRISFTAAETGLVHAWRNPKKCFNAYDVEAGAVELFFQISSYDKSIVRVTHVSADGFEKFNTTFLMRKAEFLDHVGLKNGECKPPRISSFADKIKYQAFKEKYNICLNPQQERAMLSTEGSVLLLAVPGSGKTTVLIDRIGYMILEKNISPENILALTYNNKARDEMKERFAEKFGSNLKVDFKTINAFANKIYQRCCIEEKKSPRALIDNPEKRKLLKDIYKKFSNDKYITYEDTEILSTDIGFIKNNQLYGDDHDYFFSNADLHFVDTKFSNMTIIYDAYQKELHNHKKMDFDDQVYFGIMCLKTHPDLLSEYRRTYRYICVDEAQDTSKLQHQLIKLLAEGNNLFMVGDEDQCIYGFRGAYPKALLNFRFDYRNPLILKMETNYRSTPAIVTTAQNFISQYTGRYNKNMTAFRSAPEKVKILNVTTRTDQFRDLAARLMKSQGETVVLFRNNDTLLPLIDFLNANKISYNCKKPAMKFFQIRSVTEMLNFLKLLVNPNEIKLYTTLHVTDLRQINKTSLNYVIHEIQGKGIKLEDILKIPDRKISDDELGHLISFDMSIKNTAGKNTADAIQSIMDRFQSIDNALNYNSDKIEILKVIASAYPEISVFLDRIETLKNLFDSGGIDNSSNITLSSIHNSKGLEFKTVYIIDVYDGHFPINARKKWGVSKDYYDGDIEERRLFYVALTRAKDNLFLYSLADKTSSFINEIKFHSAAVCDVIDADDPAE